jgi:DNA-binding beta-propeller fold protein YncE
MKSLISASIFVTMVFLLFLFGWQAAVNPAEGPYQFSKEIPIGGEGGWDYLSLDTAGRRLYVTHGTKVVVIDVDKDAVVGEITGVAGVHGFALAPDLNRGFASAGQESKAAIVDLKTLQIITKVDTGENPDAILYEPGHKEVYAFNGRGKSATVFDAATGVVRATIPLPGKPEFAQVDPNAGRIYNNIEDTSQLAVIDTATHQVIATWPIAPGEEASGLAFDIAHHRLFIGCSNKMMVMMDSRDGKVLGSVPIGQGVDANSFDPETGFAFASCGDGTLTVARVDEAGKLNVVQTVSTPLRSRTMTLDPKTHKLYLSAAKFEAPAPAPALKPGEKRPRPKMEPGSFKVVVYEMK